MNRFREQGKPFNLVLLIPVYPEEITSNYAVILSAPWMDPLSPGEAIRLFLEALIEVTGSTQALAYQRTARVAVIHSQDPLVQAVTSTWRVPQAGKQVLSGAINGVNLERAILLESRPPQAA